MDETKRTEKDKVNVFVVTVNLWKGVTKKDHGSIFFQSGLKTPTFIQWTVLGLAELFDQMTLEDRKAINVRETALSTGRTL